MVKVEKKWWHQTIVYQVYPRSFYDTNADGIGDLKGVIEKLDYIKSLGVTMIWLNPIFSSPNDDNGYDISDFYGIMDEFGTIEDVEELIAEAHKRDLKIMFDFVMNHTSDEHPWFIESRKSKDNPYRDFYIWKEGHDGEEPTNWEGFFGGSVWEKDEGTNEYYMHLFSKKMPDLNWESEKMRQSMYDVARFWANKGVDGLRIDAIIHIAKDHTFPQGINNTDRPYVLADQYYANLPQVHDFVKEFHQEVLMEGNLLTVGEASTAGVEEAIQYANPKNKEFDMIISFQHLSLDFDDSITYVPPKWSQKKMDLLVFKDVMERWQHGLKDKGWNTLYWNNHDMPRVVSRFGNEDKYHRESAKMLATLMYLQWGTPYILQGEEIGMTNTDYQEMSDYRDVEVFTLYREAVEKGGRSHDEIMDMIHRRSRDNARTPMQWNNEKNAGFTTGNPWMKVNRNYQNINVEKENIDADSILNYYRKLLHLKRDDECLIYGDFQFIYRNHPQVYAYTRTDAEKKYTIICNFDEQVTEVVVEEIFGEYVMGNYVDIEIKNNKLTLRPYEAHVFCKVIK